MERRAAAFPIVAVGASGGGVEAVNALLKSLPPRTGMAFVLILHMDPARQSEVSRTLSRVSRIPVTEAADGTTVEPNRVYIVPSNTEPSIQQGAVVLEHRRSADGRHLPVDRFFRALAEDQSRVAIGVVLAGTAADGAQGIKAIKAAGGITFTQGDQSAAHAARPVSAIPTGCVDFVLPPQKIGAELVRLAKHPYAASRSLRVERRPRAADDGKYGTICALLQAAKGVDFLGYNPSIINRRIARRMALLKLSKLEEYIEVLNQAPAELQALYEDILARFTLFFPDPEAFLALRQAVLAKLVSGGSTGGGRIRIWVPGCATGEEVYSLAVPLLEELGSRAGKVRIQIFGTDVSEAALQTARTGFYPESSLAETSTERLKRFFVKVNGGYQISKSLRAMCLFGRHDVAKDPPFSNLDLISCRSLLVLMSPMLQKRVVETLHYALKPGGHLFLGPAESLAGYSHLFSAEDSKHKIFVRKPAGGIARPCITADRQKAAHWTALAAVASVGAVERKHKRKTGLPGATARYAGGRQGRRVAGLERELAAAAEQQRTIVEEYETASEELKAANEEIVSNNEELQIAKQELQASAQELQCTNEELITLNEELRTRNEEVSQLNADLTNLLTGLELPVLIFDGDRRIRRATPAAEKLLHVIPADVGRPFMHLATGLRVTDWDAWFSEVLDQHRTVEREVQDRDGRWYSLQMRPYRVEHDQIGGVLMALLDVDLSKRAEERTARLYGEARQEIARRERVEQELRRSNEELGQFAFAISHDLRSPLNAITSFAQQLEEEYHGQLGTDADTYLRYITGAAARLRRLITALLEYSRTAKEDSIEAGPVDSQEALLAAELNLQEKAREAGAVVGHDPLPEVAAGSGLLVQVFQNLIENAIKFRSGQPPRIHVSAERRGEEWVFCVADNGMGIDPVHATDVFRVFKRLHGDEFEGTGIGLALCKKIVERQGGRIWVESNLGHGAKFYFTLSAASSSDPLKPTADG